MANATDRIPQLDEMAALMAGVLAGLRLGRRFYSKVTLLPLVDFQAIYNAAGDEGGFIMEGEDIPPHEYAAELFKLLRYTPN